MPVIVDIALWGLAATVAATVILEGSRVLGLSRLSLPFILGTALSVRRDHAVLLGFVVWLLGGWIFSAVYAGFFASLGSATTWIGAIFGLVHGAFLLVVLTIAPHIHPRMASDYAAPTAAERLEPPGIMGMNYGFRTPLTTLLAQAVYGAVLGAGLQTGG